jgi:DNA replication and repair protein RecF
MDQLFIGPASDRRRFFDRLVLAVDSEHLSRVGGLERALRSRNRLLEEVSPDPHWLDAIEHETAEIAVAVAAARRETLQRLRSAIEPRKETQSVFPWAEVELDGVLEALLTEHTAVEVEDHYRAALRESRGRDAAAGRTLVGPHLTDFVAKHGPKEIAAADASTGEQKALLIGLVLAHAALVAGLCGTAPVLLLDEVVAHLDPQRRAALYESISELSGQVWITGADPAAFSDIAPQAQLFEISPGRAEPR